MSTIGNILLWLGWGVLVAVGAVVTLFMTAFGDAPSAGAAVRRAITPVMLWMAMVIVGGVALINRGAWWSILLAYVLAPSPPLVWIGLISMLMARSRGRSGS